MGNLLASLSRILAHARRKFFATNKSQLAEQALCYIQLLYEIESEVCKLEPDLRRRIRQKKAVPVMDALHAWIIAQCQIVHDGSAHPSRISQIRAETPTSILFPQRIRSFADS
ncbi:hypothetical protein BK664_01880 [Pseudomonas brassicacearum]|uniref:Transposase IS66 central domain-containing protein n=1 Tax=Pseudomonas brassicacearum TaxID=930166 RepID=A0A423JXD6_9PSED|nr:hypothetical protein BK664_01880 [Pseudomonas brassicacearum]